MSIARITLHKCINHSEKSRGTSLKSAYFSWILIYETVCIPARGKNVKVGKSTAGKSSTAPEKRRNGRGWDYTREAYSLVLVFLPCSTISVSTVPCISEHLRISHFCYNQSRVVLDIDGALFLLGVHSASPPPCSTKR